MARIGTVVCAALLFVLGATSLAAEIDIDAIQRRLDANAAAINDLDAKLGTVRTAPEGVLSLRKNATVTIGGIINTRHHYRSAELSGGPFTVFPGDIPEAIKQGAPASLSQPLAVSSQKGKGILWYERGSVGSESHARGNYYRGHESLGDLEISDAKLTFKIDVNENFDAFLKFNLQSYNRSGYDTAEAYWVRWKNIRNSGFGLKVGRDTLPFGEATPIGVLDTYAAGDGDGIAEAQWRMSDVMGHVNSVTGVYVPGDNYYADFSNPLHNNWDGDRYVQITPSWESGDGRFGAEFSLYQNWDWYKHAKRSRRGNSGYYSGNTWKVRSYAISASARLRWRPIEGLLLSGSVANFRDTTKHAYGSLGVGRQMLGYRWGGSGIQGGPILGGDAGAKNNIAIDLAFIYRPAAFNRLNVWGQWIHGMNVDNIKDLDSDTVNLGVSFDVNRKWTIFAMGDYMSSRGYQKAFGVLSSQEFYGYYDSSGQSGDLTGWGLYPYLGYDRATAWSSYVGVKYALPHGLSAEVGWKYEHIKWKGGKWYNAKNKGEVNKLRDVLLRCNTIYAHLGWEF